ncbi:hypothetical protein COCON_G00115400 [Conger conger]|uniref:Spermatogenesis-associated protein 6 N-terminal domain-containing protein n=1 Tax=Conger conger TaxID=82655 RepID=A0A9Q1DFN0_CONCO|nr:hypothetical protein COCON_G00115400 [Conger conger]
MSQKATKVVVELHIRAVTCPGVFLVDKDDVYLSVCIMRHYKNTLYHPAVFPLILNEKMRFEKVFRQVHDPAEVAELLESETVTFQLIQQIPPAGESLAYFEVDTRSFLFPEPKLVPSSSGVDREVLMTRAPTFPGIAPRIEFSTRTTIIECSARSEDVINPGVPPRIAPRKANSKRNVSHRSAVRLPVTGREGSRPEPEVNGARSDSKQRSPQHLPQTSVKKELLRRTFPLPPRSRPVADFRGVINRSHSSGWAREPEEAEFPSPGAEDRSHATVTRSPRRGGQGRSRSPESQYMWEEIHDRVRALLTSTRAMRRLAYGATDSEIDDREQPVVQKRKNPTCLGPDAFQH